ncbi:Uncharacterized small protein [Yersinia frederiksenii]|nr:Uncharacterized small protein [Yersinia frederiksenii]
MSISDPKIGDLVNLKSGGPVMTIKNVIPTYASSRIVCTWFTKDGQLIEGEFRAEIIERLDHQSNPVEGGE